MSILVTGAAGFIGFHLINSLLNDGFSVIGIDSINNYYDVKLKINRLKVLGINDIENKCNVGSRKGFIFFKCDINDKMEIDKIFQLYPLDYVVNLAAQPGVRYSVENPDVYIQDNINGFMNILNICVKYNTKHLVYASSSSVYGSNKSIHYSESTNTDNPVSLYAATKKCDEILAHSYSSLYNLPTTGLRFFTVYGPWGRPDMSAYKFANAIINNIPIDIYNYGNMTRDFTYIDDIINGIRLVLFKPPEKKINSLDNSGYISEVPFDIYNIGSSKPTTLLNYIHCFEKAINKEAIKNFLPLQKGDVENTYADISKIVKEFSFEPKTTIEEGVKKYVEWHLHYYKQQKE